MSAVGRPRSGRSSVDGDEPPSARWALIFAAIAILIVKSFVPFGGTLLYPFTLLATWVHEMGHGLTALALGGGFDSLDVYGDASGLAFTRIEPGWRSAIVSAGGLVGPPLAGASILAIARGPRRARVVLFAMSAAIAISAVVWVRSLTGWIALPVVALAIGLVALRGGASSRMIAAHFVGVIFALDTVSRIDYCFTPEARIGGQTRPSDVAGMATGLGGPWLVWGIVVAVSSIAMLAIGLVIAWRPASKRSPRSA